MSASSCKEVFIVGGGDCYHENYEILAVFLDPQRGAAWLHAYAQKHGLEPQPNRQDYYLNGLAYACLMSYEVEDGVAGDTRGGGAVLECDGGASDGEHSE